MTIKAVRALEESRVVVGYTVYADLMREHFPGKEWITTPMRQETERGRMAIEMARSGLSVALVRITDHIVAFVTKAFKGMSWHPEVSEVER